VISHRAVVVGYLYKSLECSLDEHDINLDPGPFWHSAPRDFATLAIYLGGTAIVTRQFEPSQYLELVERHGVTNSFLVPTMLQMIGEAADTCKSDVSTLKLMLSAGSPLATVVKNKIIERFGPILHECYGATETRMITSIKAEELGRMKRCVGRAARDVEIRVLDSQGEDVPSGAVGEVFVRGPGLFSGYFRDPERTRASHRGDWFSLGDMGKMDEEGYLYLVDRKQDMIISGGENIFPNDIEEALLTHPGIKEAAVIGTPHPTWGELVTAIVVAKPDSRLDPEELIAHCATALPGYMKPRRVEFVDALPRNPVGKVLRNVLREQYWAKEESRI
jgi:acyl-CoA synthetase (AMP-forming)/AMP-acid ligase II